jgi:hypothetical protein
MVRHLLAVAALIGVSTSAGAQDRGVGGLPASVSQDITRIYNDSRTTRRSGITTIDSSEVIDGDLAIRSGPVTIVGRVRGSLLIINADVTFRPGSRIEGNVLVVGGRVAGRDDADITGDVRVYSETLRYRLSGDEIVIEASEAPPQSSREDDEFWRRRTEETHTRFDALEFASAGPYNRVEGLPIKVGPRLRLRRDWGELLVDARGIVRTAEPMEWDRGTLGHDAKIELRWGRGVGLGVGAAHFDRVEPIEEWHMTDSEASKWAVFFHRDYRDYFVTHGGGGFVRAYLAENASISFGVSEERWTSRDERDPWTLFRGNKPWWPNPSVDDGKARLTTTSFLIDSRNQRNSPRSGWFVQADLERGKFDPFPVAVPGTDPPTFSTASSRDYSRGFFDIRRYNRVGPGAQLNLRAVMGGWLDGDELPLQRRLSVGGPGTLPGFDYRRHWRGGEDRLQCSEVTTSASALPALCDRVALFQVEYRGALSWHTDDDGSDRWLPSEFHFPTWVVFADAGRGWRAKGNSSTTYALESFPEFSTFKTDVGIGLDFGSLSVSAAKAMSDKEEPINVVVRLSRRF